MASVLVVDDEADVRLLVRLCLTRSGHEVHEATDGNAAVALLAALPGVDLVVTDVQMPGMDGLALREVLAGERPALPVHVWSSEGSTAVAGIRRKDPMALDVDALLDAAG